MKAQEPKATPERTTITLFANEIPIVDQAKQLFCEKHHIGHLSRSSFVRALAIQYLEENGTKNPTTR